MKIIATSGYYPLVPIVGIPRHVNALRTGLWGKLQDAMTQIHKQPRAIHFIEDWRVGHFSLPSDEYRMQVQRAAAEFPLSDLAIGFGELPADVSR